MSEINIQIKQRNQDNTGWINLYPATKAAVVTSTGGETMEQHVNNTDKHITATERASWNEKADGADLTSHVNNNIVHITSSEREDWNAKATTAYVDGKIAALVDSAPETLDTLSELAEALGNDPNFAATVSNQIGNKLAKSQLDTNVELGLSDEKVPSQKAVKTYVDNSVSTAGYGDMLKNVYDTNNNGRVDAAEFAERARIETSEASQEPAVTEPGEIWFAAI
jgi:hypothetical protein